MSDDLSMKALKGSFSELTERTLRAGCDLILHCNGKMDEMRQVASVAPELTGDAARRSAAALAARKKPQTIDLEAARREFAAMINQQIA